MKHRTSDLSGALLDAAVAKAEGMHFEILDLGIPESGRSLVCHAAEGDDFGARLQQFLPSTMWHLGGPIIEREGIALVRDGGMWDAHVGGYYCHDDGVASIHDFEMGSTPLIAAMRAYVGSKLGPEVELP
jgi:hypothetical protein